MEGTVSFCSECGFPSLSFFFLFKIFYWTMIALKYCAGFCHTSTWISHTYLCPFWPETTVWVTPGHEDLSHCCFLKWMQFLSPLFFCFPLPLWIMKQINASFLKVQQNQLIHLSWMYILCCCGFRDFFFFQFRRFGICITTAYILLYHPLLPDKM